MTEILIALQTIAQLAEGIKEASEFLRAGEEIPPATLRKLQVQGNQLDSDLDALIERRDSDGD